MKAVASQKHVKKNRPSQAVRQNITWQQKVKRDNEQESEQRYVYRGMN